jgi:hypothetical protein
MHIQTSVDVKRELPILTQEVHWAYVHMIRGYLVKLLCRLGVVRWAGALNR